jgi:hypothetical protein
MMHGQNPHGAPGSPFGGAAAYGPPSGGGSYEFGPTENTVVASVAGRASSWGAVSIVVGVLQVLVGFATLSTPTAAVTQLISGVAAILVGVTFRGVGASFKAVVETQGNDIGNLLTALRGLDRALLIQLLALLIAFVVGFAVAIAVAASRA